MMSGESSLFILLGNLSFSWPSSEPDKSLRWKVDGKYFGEETRYSPLSSTDGSWHPLNVDKQRLGASLMWCSMKHSITWEACLTEMLSLGLIKPLELPITAFLQRILETFKRQLEESWRIQYSGYFIEQLTQLFQQINFIKKRWEKSSIREGSRG